MVVAVVGFGFRGKPTEGRVTAYLKGKEKRDRASRVLVESEAQRTACASLVRTQTSGSHELWFSVKGPRQMSWWTYPVANYLIIFYDSKP